MGSVNYNSVLAVLNIQPSEKIIFVKENGLADSNFILSHLMKLIFANDSNRLCLVMLHHTEDHYMSVGKRLGYDLQKKINDGTVRTVTPIKSIAEDLLTESMRFLNPNKELLAKFFFTNIANEINILEDGHEGDTYLIIDDLSHLLDMEVDVQHINTFINCCINLPNICTIINYHVATNRDELIVNSFDYIADVVIDVSPLKTGRSYDVSGILTVSREKQGLAREANMYHYKAYDRGIKTFKPGDALIHL